MKIGPELQTTISPEKIAREKRDWELLKTIDFSLAKKLGKAEFLRLKEELKGRAKWAIDIGAARNPLRAFSLLGVEKVMAIDPNYADFTEWEWLTKNLQAALRLMFIFEIKEPDVSWVVKGFRHESLREIYFSHIRAEGFLKELPVQSVPAFVSWRTFLPSNYWGYIIESLEIGGVLITTGYGEIESFWGESFQDLEGIGGGVEIQASPLPRNGNTSAIGMQSLTDADAMLIYEKKFHVPAEEATQALLENL